MVPSTASFAREPLKDSPVLPALGAAAAEEPSGAWARGSSGNEVIGSTTRDVPVPQLQPHFVGFPARPPPGQIKLRPEPQIAVGRDGCCRSFGYKKQKLESGGISSQSIAFESRQSDYITLQDLGPADSALISGVSDGHHRLFRRASHVFW